jgi:hypothetical protein
MTKGNNKIENIDESNGQPQIYGTSSQQIEYQGVVGGPGVPLTHSTKQEKKRKRPDDKK